MSGGKIRRCSSSSPVSGRLFALVRTFFAALILCSAVLAGGCTRALNSYYSDSLPPQEGRITLPGLNEPAAIRRDDMGIPFIEAQSMDDLACAIGYAHASDRLTQMVGFKLLAQGRLSEMVGPPALDIDIFIRTVNLPKSARILFDSLNEREKQLLDRYAQGVNAYIEEHRANLPPGLAMSAYDPGKWESFDSLSIFSLVNLLLAFNMEEEIYSIILAQAVGPQKMAWLFPISPDEPIPMDEARKLDGIDLKGKGFLLAHTGEVVGILASLGLTGMAASNNWAIAKERTKNKASIFANDTHLLLSMPSMWSMMHVRSREFDAAGVSIAGLPNIVAGYNGHIAWGMTMVMADNQDLFLERLKQEEGRLFYLYKGSWLPVEERRETINVRGKKPANIVVHETVHGPLLNNVLKKSPKLPLMPGNLDLPLGVAFSWAAFDPEDKSVQSFLSLCSAQSVREALPLVRQVQAIPLNMVIADRDNIAWQVTGRYPVRKSGRGFMPSPGWTGEYDWKGFLDVSVLPHSLNPSQGYIGTANNKTVSKDYPYILSSSWYWPDRADRIGEMAASTSDHTYKTSMEMQLDVHSISGLEMRRIFTEGALSDQIAGEIDSWSDRKMQEKAREALSMLKDFDGNMDAGSKTALLVSSLTITLTRDIFLDELGPENSGTWKAFVSCNSISYNATSDHIMVRGNESPFWDDITTPAGETKAQIMARSLARSIDLIESRLGRDRSRWSWGRLHTYDFMTEASRMAPHMDFFSRTVMSFLSPFFDRGPFPAPGDYNTLNVSAYMIGRNFETWLIPAMRLVVDFSLEEPCYAINSTGQSDNPASPHYDDGVHAWLKGSYQSFPFAHKNIEKQYTRVLELVPEKK
jgi:acyl-homoserine-lactone acylase